MYFNGSSWWVSDELDKKSANLINQKIRPNLRDSGPMRLLQKVINRMRVKEQSCSMLKYGWYYGTRYGWKKDASLVLDWLQQEPCRRVEGGGGGVVLEKEAHSWRDILGLEEADRASKRNIASHLLIIFGWVRFIRSRIIT